MPCSNKKNILLRRKWQKRIFEWFTKRNLPSWRPSGNTFYLSKRVEEKHNIFNWILLLYAYPLSTYIRKNREKNENWEVKKTLSKEKRYENCTHKIWLFRDRFSYSSTWFHALAKANEWTIIIMHFLCWWEFSTFLFSFQNQCSKFLPFIWFSLFALGFIISATWSHWK